MLSQVFKYMPVRQLAFLSLIIALVFSSCKKNLDYSLSGSLNFSTDTVKFDTVFATIGSATHNFLIKNTSSSPLQFNHVRLGGGNTSFFRINIDGRATNDYQNYKIAAHDSAFVFVEVTIDPNNKTLPFIITDSIMFENNSGRQKVILEAYGQNAHFLSDSVMNYNAVWDNKLPYVIHNSVLLTSGHTLTINEGTKIYSHRNSFIYIGGTLVVNGTKADPVIFTGDRLESIYASSPGQWAGIRFLPKSKDNNITHAIISNGAIGVEVDSLPHQSSLPNLTISKTIIRNMTSAGLVGYSSAIDGRNLLIYSCGQNTFYGDLGGSYTFIHCTFDNSNSTLSQRSPSVFLSNEPYKDLKGNLYYIPLSSVFTNCIIWGSLDDEVKEYSDAHTAFSATFNKNIIRALKVPFDTSNLINKDPLFTDIYSDKYDLGKLSPAINTGLHLTGTAFVKDDITDFARDAQPDLGCYEKH